MAVDYAHHEMHAGSFYFIKTWLLNNGASATYDYFAFTTPDTEQEAHARVTLSSDADTTFQIFEAGTITGGTPVAGINANRNSTNTANLAAVAAPTVSTEGSRIWAARTGGGRDPSGVSPSFGYEIIAKRNTTYVFKLTKNTSADTVIDIDFFWYEHTPRG